MNLRSSLLITTAAMAAGVAILCLSTRGTETALAAPMRSRQTQDVGSQAGIAKGVVAESVVAGSSADAALQPHQRELLELAFATASAIPTMPHIKARSRAQERVLVTCLELEQSQRALRYIEKIDNWRRGVGYADLAFFFAQKGDEQEAARFLAKAREHVDEMSLAAKTEEDGFDGNDEALEGYQAWRLDRVRAKIARTYLWLGQDEKAIEFEEGLEPSECGMVEVVRARTLDPKEIENVAAALDTVATEGDLERVRNAVNVGLRCLERFYGDEPKRQLFLRKLEACLAKTPVMLRIDYSISIADIALDEGDADTARQFLARAEEVLGSTPLSSEDEIPLRAHLAGLRHRAGEQARARSEIDAAAEKFQAARMQIGDLQRADVLLPLAETYAAMGDAAAALRIYAQAARDGAENPNAVPRADDLVALCCSMARNAVEPDTDLWLRIHRTNAELHEPW